MAPERVTTALAAGLRVCIGLLITALIGLEVVQVILRYLFASGIVWGRDVSTLMMFSIAWLGAPLLWLSHRHLAVDLLPSSLTAGRLWSGLLDGLVILSALALLYLTTLAMRAFAFIDLPSLGTSAAIKFWPMAAGTALLAVAGAINLVTAGRRQ